MNDALVLLNPNAGRGRAKKVFERGMALLPTGAARPRIETVLAASRDEALERTVESLRGGGYDRLIVIGGDGSGSMAAQALVEAGVIARTAFGLVPAGTGSDFVRQLEPGCVAERRLVRLLTSQEIRSCDLTEACTASGARRFSINVASAGLSSAVNERVNAKSRHGGSSYLLTTVASLIGYRPYRCRVEADDKPVFDGPLFLVAIANSRFFGNGMMVAPEARIDDGLLDLVVVPPLPKWQMPWKLPRFLKGRHLHDEEVIFERARRVRLEPAPELPSYDLDGDSYPAEPVTFTVLPGKLRLVV